MSNIQGTFKKGHTVPESWRKKISAALTGNRMSEEARKNMCLAQKGRIHSDESKRKLSNNAKTNPNYGMKGKHHTIETRKKLSQSNKGRRYSRLSTSRNSPHSELNSKEWLEKMYLINKSSSTQISEIIGCSNRAVLDALHYFDINVRSYSEAKRGSLNPHSNGISEAHKQKIREYRIGKWDGNNNPWYGKTGEDHFNWKGGIGFAPYCHKFNNKLKENIRNRDNRICQLCGKDEIDCDRLLDVHHIHYDKPNCEPDLISLCRSCHAKVNGNRDYYEDLFTENLQRRGLNG